MMQSLWKVSSPDVSFADWVAEKLAAGAGRMAHFITRHWLLTANLALLLFIAPPFLAPVLSAAGVELPARLIYALYRLTCHQIPSRSFFILGRPVAICARCSAIYLAFWGVGLAYGLWGLSWRKRLAWPPLCLGWLLVLLLPLAVDGTGQFLGLWESTNFRRTLTGALAGGGFGLFLYPTLEIGFKEVKEGPGPEVMKKPTGAKCRSKVKARLNVSSEM